MSAHRTGIGVTQTNTTGGRVFYEKDRRSSCRARYPDSAAIFAFRAVAYVPTFRPLRRKTKCQPSSVTVHSSPPTPLQRPTQTIS